MWLELQRLLDEDVARALEAVLTQERDVSPELSAHAVAWLLNEWRAGNQPAIPTTPPYFCARAMVAALQIWCDKTPLASFTGLSGELVC
jgi:hypothetical protein